MLAIGETSRERRIVMGQRRGFDWGPIVMAALAILALAYELSRDRGLNSGHATVVGIMSFGRNPSRELEMVLTGAPGANHSYVRCYFHPYRPRTVVPVLFNPLTSEVRVINTFWERHWLSSLTGAFAVGLIGFKRWQASSHSRLEGTVVDPRVEEAPQFTGQVRLPIDTAPRLWDRDVDGPVEGRAGPR